MILLIAYGNSLRRDDGAGFILAEKLEQLFLQAGQSVVRLEVHQLTPELSLDISKENISAVIFLDTRAVTESGDDLLIRVEKVAPAEIGSPSMGHHLDVSLLLAYTAYLFKTPPPSWLVTVPGVDFNHGEGLSQVTTRAIENPPAELDELIDRIKKMHL